jgi:glutathione synthase/RimK-type ligase-like ATP-grasp enzyme
LAAFVAESFNLRLCGLDLACEDINDPDSAYFVIEVNGAPGLDHYAMAGDAQQKIVDDLYTKVFNTA